MTQTVTQVEISFYKPTGFADTHYVDTSHRGMAMFTVMAEYNMKMLACVNSANVTLRDRKMVPEGMNVLKELE